MLSIVPASSAKTEEKPSDSDLVSSFINGHDQLITELESEHSDTVNERTVVKYLNEQKPASNYIPIEAECQQREKLNDQQHLPSLPSSAPNQDHGYSLLDIKPTTTRETTSIPCSKQTSPHNNKRVLDTDPKEDSTQENRTKRRKYNNLGVSKSTLRFIHKGLTLTCQEIERLSQQHTESLLQEKKLVLILDLDHTLLHSSHIEKISNNEALALIAARDRDTTVVSLWKDFLIKLRPFVHRFLREMSKMYEMYICMMGIRAYALHIANFLDPEGVYFKDKVIAREDSTDPTKKDLDIVLGEERVTLIVDDSYVWKRHGANQIVIAEYNFFGSNTEELKKESDAALCSISHLLRNVHQRFFDVSSTTSLSDRDVRPMLIKCFKETEQKQDGSLEGN